jgi:hypothetical protein
MVQLSVSLLDSMDFYFRARTTSIDLQHTLQLFQRNSIGYWEEEKDHDKVQKHFRGEEAKKTVPDRVAITGKMPDKIAFLIQCVPKPSSTLAKSCEAHIY